MAAGGYRTCFRAAQDYDLWLRMVEQGPIANIAEPLIYYRIHSEQATVRKLHQQVWGVIAAQHAARQRRAGRPDPLDGVAEITEATIRSFGVAPDESVAMAAAFEDRVATHLLLSQRPQALSYGEPCSGRGLSGSSRSMRSGTASRWPPCGTRSRRCGRSRNCSCGFRPGS
jgi:hypothetical protein